MRRLHVTADLPLRPCTADYAAMTPAPGGRHCDHCHKTVHDLSTMTRSAAEKFVAARADVPSCYRYLARRDGALVFAREPARLPLLALTLAACAPWGPGPEPAMDDAPAEYPAPASVVIPTRDDPPDARGDDPPDPADARDPPPDPPPTTLDPPPSRPRTRHLPPEHEPLLTPRKPQEPTYELHPDDYSHIMGGPM